MRQTMGFGQALVATYRRQRLLHALLDEQDTDREGELIEEDAEVGGGAS